MRILVTGKGGRAGSWQIRGEQLGRALGAEVAAPAGPSALARAQIVVVVKRVPDSLLRALRAAGKPWILDLVDGWPQPAGNDWPAALARSWLRDRLAALAPAGVVFPTARMAADSGWRGPALVLPHHAWPKYEPQPVADRILRVGYEGAPSYLGRWLEAAQAACAARGAELVINGDLASCQVGLALRDASGYPCGAWKANTKVANLQALGIPAIISPETSYLEFGSGREIIVETPAQLGEALDYLAPRRIREEIAAAGILAAPRLGAVAKRYREWLCASRFC
jgi:hypothetical protein